MPHSRYAALYFIAIIVYLVRVGGSSDYAHIDTYTPFIV